MSMIVSALDGAVDIRRTFINQSRFSLLNDNYLVLTGFCSLSWLGAMNSETGKRSFSLEGPSVITWNLEPHSTSRSWRLTLSDLQYKEVVFAGSRGEDSEIWFRPEPAEPSHTFDLFIEPI